MGKKQRAKEVMLRDRIQGGLLGVAAGDCLGSLVEFKSRESVRKEYPNGVREIIGGGPFNWRIGQGTDDSDMTAAVLRSYVSPERYSIKGVADNFAKWKQGGPRDIGGTTSGGISSYIASGNPLTSGRTDDYSAANGSLMRCIPTGLLVDDKSERAIHAAQISGVTHGEPRAVDSCIAYCDMVNRMIHGDTPEQSINWVLDNRSLDPRVEEVLRTTPDKDLDELDGSGYVLGSLGVAVWAATRDPDQSVEDILAQTISLGQDTDTHGAIAGGLLGASRGASALPERWVDVLEYGDEFQEAVPEIMDIREDDKPKGFLSRIFPNKKEPTLITQVLAISNQDSQFCESPTKSSDGTFTGPPCRKHVSIGAKTCGEVGHLIPASRWSGQIPGHQGSILIEPSTIDAGSLFSK